MISSKPDPAGRREEIGAVAGQALVVRAVSYTTPQTDYLAISTRTHHPKKSPPKFKFRDPYPAGVPEPGVHQGRGEYLNFTLTHPRPRAVARVPAMGGPPLDSLGVTGRRGAATARVQLSRRREFRVEGRRRRGHHDDRCLRAPTPHWTRTRSEFESLSRPGDNEGRLFIFSLDSRRTMSKNGL